MLGLDRVTLLSNEEGPDDEAIPGPPRLGCTIDGPGRIADVEDAGPTAVDAGPIDEPVAPIALRSAAFRISSLVVRGIQKLSLSRSFFFRRLNLRTHSSRFKHAHATTHSTQSSLPSPNVCQTFFSSSVFPVIVIRVPPPRSGEFLETLPNSTLLGGI